MSNDVLCTQERSTFFFPLLIFSDLFSSVPCAFTFTCLLAKEMLSSIPTRPTVLTVASLPSSS